jgi:hypothetical protein
MQGTWTYYANFNLIHDSQTFVCSISNATINVGEVTTSGSSFSDFPYHFIASLDGSALVCASSDTTFETELKSVTVDAYRALVVVGLDFMISMPLGELQFNCVAGMLEGEQTGPNQWSGRLTVDLPSTEISIDGSGTFEATRQ